MLPCLVLPGVERVLPDLPYVSMRAERWPARHDPSATPLPFSLAFQIPRIPFPSYRRLWREEAREGQAARNQHARIQCRLHLENKKNMRNT